MQSGIERIADELAKRRAEGTAAAGGPDAEALASAAACHATPHKWRPFPVRAGGQPPLIWPWSAKQWKPIERIDELALAGALIAEEIDRLQRGDAGA